jgi:hypothetical protein
MACNKENKKRLNREWRRTHSDAINERQRQQYRDNHSEALTYQRDYRSKTKEKQSEYNKSAYQKRKLRYLSDVNFKLAASLRNRLGRAIKGNYKSGSAVNDLGCSVQEFKFYIESKFQLGMTWDNWSKDGWHIDHIKPLCKFDLSNSDQLKQACHFTNLQPLWVEDHKRKTAGEIYENTFNKDK